MMAGEMREDAQVSCSGVPQVCEGFPRGVRGRRTVIGLLGRVYDRFAQRVGHTTAGSVVLGVGAVVWFLVAWALGGAW
jgi:hypothetical protein